jgi:hypothetical protein
MIIARWGRRFLPPTSRFVGHTYQVIDIKGFVFDSAIPPLYPLTEGKFYEFTTQG